jgi:hypothetical protein
VSMLPRQGLDELRNLSKGFIGYLIGGEHRHKPNRRTRLAYDLTTGMASESRRYVAPLGIPAVAGGTPLGDKKLMPNRYQRGGPGAGLGSSLASEQKWPWRWFHKPPPAVAGELSKATLSTIASPRPPRPIDP